MLGPLLFVVLAFSIYYKVRNQASLQEAKDLLSGALSNDNIPVIILLLTLVAINWGIEARKWHVLVKRIQPVNYFTAYKAVLSGVSLSLFVPNGIGDYAGRLVYMNEGNRLKSITLTLVGSMAQLIVTLSAGLAGLLYLKNGSWANLEQFKGLSVFLVNGIIFMIAAGSLLLLVIFFKLNWLTIMFEKIPFVHKYRFMVEYLETISRKDLTRILSLSAGRYCIFIVQYIAMLHIFSVQLGTADAIATIAVLFLVLAILPTIPVADLGMRGEAGLQLFGLLSLNKLGIIATTAGIWLINLILPAVAGSLFILGIKLFRNR
ncbi:lysylphosphatidylglycerol synthase domain-containing protein [Panacibacter microcysteis]|uniref:lysylphosphatidylglycerol synthase domain-containing protein n=1 Tax=Panacibacter microcysteis TaxID=2793269 RepID=UPI0031FE0450